MIRLFICRLPVLLLGLFLLVGCCNNSEASNPNPVIVNKIAQQYQQWQGTPYLFGGESKSGVDCSGLVRNFYATKLHRSVPRSTISLARMGKRVKNPQPGDLVFFKTGGGKTGLHVGIYFRNGMFLHSSSRHGVVYGNLSNPYWQSKFWMARRI